MLSWMRTTKRKLKPFAHCSFHPPGDAHLHYGQSSIFTFMLEIYMAAGISD
jgi:hypothetical protein